MSGIQENELKFMSIHDFAKADPEVYTVVDMREPGIPPELAIAGSVNIPFSQWFQRMDEVPAEKPVILVCQIGICSELAGEILAEKGYDVYTLDGGYAAYRAAYK